MALILGVKIGDVVDIAENWIAILSVSDRHSATLITNDAEKVMSRVSLRSTCLRRLRNETFRE